jgi:sulfate transport system permease protein
MREKRFNALPGFGLTMGYTLLYLSLIVLIPLGGLFLNVCQVGVHSSEIAPSELENPGGLADRLRERTDPVSAFLWNELPPELQQAVSNAPSELESSSLATNLAVELNRVVQGGAVHNESRFENVTLSEKSRWLLDHRLPGVTSWLNRSLMEDAYPGILKKKANWLDLWLTVSSDRALASYRLSFGASFLAAVVNAVFGTLLAWVLVRYEFPAKRFLDALVDFPFALPTAVAGLTLADLFSKNGWLGRHLAQSQADGELEAITLTYPMLGVVIALTFVGLPFVVRTLQPVLESFEREVEEASATLGAGRLRTFLTIVAPTLLPAILTGFALAFARSIGEFGSVIFIASNIPYESEIAPLLIFTRLEEWNISGAMAIAVVMLTVSFLLLITINLLERWASRYQN